MLESMSVSRAKDDSSYCTGEIADFELAVVLPSGAEWCRGRLRSVSSFQACERLK